MSWRWNDWWWRNKTYNSTLNSPRVAGLHRTFQLHDFCSDPKPIKHKKKTNICISRVLNKRVLEPFTVSTNWPQLPPKIPHLLCVCISSGKGERFLLHARLLLRSMCMYLLGGMVLVLVRRIQLCFCRLSVVTSRAFRWALEGRRGRGSCHRRPRTGRVWSWGLCEYLLVSWEKKGFI